jgi:hypothetical protein
MEYETLTYSPKTSIPNYLIGKADCNYPPEPDVVDTLQPLPFAINRDDYIVLDYDFVARVIANKENKLLQVEIVENGTKLWCHAETHCLHKYKEGSLTTVEKRYPIPKQATPRLHPTLMVTNQTNTIKLPDKQVKQQSLANQPNAIKADRPKAPSVSESEVTPLANYTEIRVTEPIIKKQQEPLDANSIHTDQTNSDLSVNEQEQLILEPLPSRPPTTSLTITNQLVSLETADAIGSLLQFIQEKVNIEFN